MIKINNGDLLKNIKSGIICHGVNAQGVMGSGIAIQIKKAYPEAFRVYFEQHKLKDSLEPGSISVASVNPHPDQPPLYIINAVTQKFYGKGGNRYVDYNAIKLCFEKINNFAIENKILDVNFPMIGAGLGGGDWTLISKIIDDTLDDSINKNLWIL